MFDLCNMFSGNQRLSTWEFPLFRGHVPLPCVIALEFSIIYPIKISRGWHPQIQTCHIWTSPGQSFKVTLTSGSFSWNMGPELRFIATRSIEYPPANMILAQPKSWANKSMQVLRLRRLFLTSFLGSSAGLDVCYWVIYKIRLDIRFHKLGKALHVSSIFIGKIIELNGSFSIQFD